MCILSFDLQLQALKNAHLGREPEDLVTPDLNVNIDAFNKFCEFIDINLPLLTDFPPDNNELDEFDFHLSSVYFIKLTNALRILNEMIVLTDEGEMVGIELSTANGSADVFDTIDPQWVNAKYYIILSSWYN